MQNKPLKYDNFHTFITIVTWFSAGTMQATTRLGLLTIDYSLTKEEWDQHTAYHQLTTWANVPIACHSR